MSNKIEELREFINASGTTQNDRIARLFGNKCYSGDIFKGGPPFGLGGVEFPHPTYPRASLSFYDTQTQHLRKQAIAKEKRENPYNYKLLPGAVVHGNVKSRAVQEAKDWRYRGGLDEAEENHGVNDASKYFEGVRLFEGTIAYLDKHFYTIVSTTDIAARFLSLLQVIYSSIVDNNLERFTFEIIDPMLVTFPHRQCRTLEELDFYPTFCSDHPEYEQRLKQWPKCDFDDDFRSDDVVSWLMTAAPTPVFDYLKPFTKYQKNFPITNSQFIRISGFENDSLDRAMSEKRLFIVDFKDFHSATVATRNWDNYGARLHASICFFAIPINGNSLKTIAIQPTQTPKADGFWGWIDWNMVKTLGYGTHSTPPSKIVTPADNYWAWQMAKNSVTTMLSMSSVVDHLSTHVYLAPIAISFFRNIPEQHPLRSLLDTHMMALITNNHTGIFEEVGIGTAPVYGNPLNGLLTGAVERLSGFSSETFLAAVLKRKDRYHFYKDSTPFERKEDPAFAQLDEYPHHDDNKMLPIIREWADKYIRLYYLSHADVARDTEVQAFLWEIRHEGHVKGFQDNADSIFQLADIVSRIIYWMSVNHGFTSLASFMKLGSLGYYNSYPIEPTTNYSEQNWLSVCPPMNVGAGMFFFSRLFTDLPEDWHRSLGKYPKGQFKHDPRIYPLLKVFEDKMKAVDDELRVINSKRRWSYDLRMPSTITVSPWN